MFLASHIVDHSLRRKTAVLHWCLENRYVYLNTGSPGDFRGPRAKERYEAPCERSEQKNLSIWELTPENY